MLLKSKCTHFMTDLVRQKASYINFRNDNNIISENVRKESDAFPALDVN